jgi:hypothetical protein
VKPDTVKLVYVGRRDAVIVPDADLTAVRGETVVIPAELAASLLASGNWKAVEAKRKVVS